MRAFKIVDVFSDAPFLGNPVAVVLEAEGLSAARMQAIAAWTNLSETTFHLPPTTPEADYRLRIFTPRSELPFAGHPTLGGAHALLEAGLVAPRDGGLVQECEAGLVAIGFDLAAGARRLRLDLPPAKIRDLSEHETARLRGALGRDLAEGAPPAVVDVGVRWVVAELPDAASVIALAPDLAAMAALETDLGVTGVTAFGAHAAGESAIEVRSFAPSDGVGEDPVCGSGNGSVAAYRLRRGTIARPATYIATQGRCVGRDGRVFVRITEDRIQIGGAAVTTVSGSIEA